MKRNRSVDFCRRRKSRLLNFDYRGCYRYSLTLCTAERYPFFLVSDTVSECIEVLRVLSAAHGFAVWIYCFMPDHLHLITEGQSADADLRKHVSMFKQRTAYSLRRYGKLWQGGFYDHVLRKEEDLVDVMLYIAENPVRKGLVGDFGEYPFTGSFELDLREIL